MGIVTKETDTFAAVTMHDMSPSAWPVIPEFGYGCCVFRPDPVGLLPIILPLWHQPIQGQDHGGKTIKATSSRCFGRLRIGGSIERAARVRRVGVAAPLLL